MSQLEALQYNRGAVISSPCIPMIYQKPNRGTYFEPLPNKDEEGQLGVHDLNF